MKKKMNIVIIAHENKKADMVQFLIRNQIALKSQKINLITTGLLGENAESSGFRVTKLLPCSMGGDAQIAAKVAKGKIKVVFFFKDPLSNHAHEVDINMLVRLCDVYNIPLATNEATAQLLVNVFTQLL